MVLEDGVYKTIKRENMTDKQTEQLVPVFENGEIIKEYPFEEVRAAAKKNL